MTDTDPLVPVLAGLVIDVAWYLDRCDDDEVDPDTAVKMLEGIGTLLEQLPPGQHDRMLGVLTGMAEAEPEPERREFLEGFLVDIGYLDDPEEPGGPGA
jgi:hypothetical protein